MVHSNLDTLLDHIEKDVLPSEYGGFGGDLEEMHDRWQQEMSNRADWFNQQEKIMEAVGLAPIPRHLYQHSCALDTTDGIQGSFRALTID